MMAFADEILARIRADLEKPKTKPAERPRPNLIEDLPGEQWKQIEGYRCYWISNKGRIKSNAQGRYKLLKQFRHLRPEIKESHYKITLINQNKKRLISVHNLVAKAFLEPSSPSHVLVAHIDGDNDNNCVENLEWITRSESRRRTFTDHPRAGVRYWDGIPLGRHSLNMGGNRSMISNRIRNNGWCLECACTIPVQKRGKNMETCLHVERP